MNVFLQQKQSEIVRAPLFQERARNINQFAFVLCTSLKICKKQMGENPRCFAMHKKPTRKDTQEQASQTANARKRSRETWANSGSLSGARLNTTKDELEKKANLLIFENALQNNLRKQLHI